MQLSDLVWGQELALVLTLTFPSGSEGSCVEVGLHVSHDGGQRVDAGLQWTYAGHSANDAQPPTPRSRPSTPRWYVPGRWP